MLDIKNNKNNKYIKINNLWNLFDEMEKDKTFDNTQDIKDILDNIFLDDNEEEVIDNYTLKKIEDIKKINSIISSNFKDY